MEKKTKATVPAADKAKEKKTVTKAKPASEKKTAVVEEKTTVKSAAKPVEHIAEPAKVAVEKKKAPALRPGKQPLAHAVGRRKTAVARVWFHRGTGKIVVNGKSYADYFTTDIMRLDASIPFRVCPVGSHYDVTAYVNGGGIGAQAGAVRLGISRALVGLHEETKSTLRQFGLLTVDSRQKERKKYGQKAARRKFQFVKR